MKSIRERDLSVMLFWHRPEKNTEGGRKSQINFRMSKSAVLLPGAECTHSFYGFMHIA